MSNEENMPSPDASVTAFRLSYARLGIYTFPVYGINRDGRCACKRPDCEHKGKHPIFGGADRGATINPKRIRRQGERFPHSNIGIHLRLSRLVCIDVDPRHGGNETLARLEARHGALNTSVVADTGGGGTHHFFAAPEGGLPDSIRGSLGPGVDLLHGNRYPVVPPSRHESGSDYRWREGCDPWNAGWLISPTPRWVLGLEKRVESDCEDDLSDDIPAGTPFDWSPEATGRLRSALEFIPADEREIWLRVGAALHHASNGGPEGRELWDEWSFGSDQFIGCPGKFDNDGQELTWEGFKADRDSPATVGSVFYMAKENGWVDPRRNSDPDTLGDISNGRRFAAHNRNEFLFVRGSGRWLHWDGQRWKACDGGQHVQAAKALADNVLRETAQALADKADDSTRRRHTLALGVHRSLPRLYALLEAASTEPGMSVPDQSAMDRDPMLLGVKNGVVDLRAGLLLDAGPDQRVSKQAGTRFDPDAKCDRWKEFLLDVFGSEEVVSFVQRLAGYTLTGSVKEEVLIFMYGTGANGKSVFANVMTALLGEYSVTVGAELLARNKAEGETARYKTKLQGARLALANEVGQADTWDDQRVKEVTSRELIPARHLYGEAFSFPPSHTLWIRGNHQPTILDASDGMWRRLILLTFAQQFAPDQRIPDLDTQLIDNELKGILAWAIQGCLEWQRIGLAPPESVSGATQQYRSESDVLGQWLTECCEARLGSRLTAGEAYQSWAAFCGEFGMSPGAQPTFTRRLKARGTKYARSNGSSYFTGIKIKRSRSDISEADEEDDGEL